MCCHLPACLAATRCSLPLQVHRSIEARAQEAAAANASFQAEVAALLQRQAANSAALVAWLVEKGQESVAQLTTSTAGTQQRAEDDEDVTASAAAAALQQQGQDGGVGQQEEDAQGVDMQEGFVAGTQVGGGGGGSTWPELQKSHKKASGGVCDLL
jgi:hypothetical protein